MPLDAFTAAFSRVDLCQASCTTLRKATPIMEGSIPELIQCSLAVLRASWPQIVVSRAGAGDGAAGYE